MRRFRGLSSVKVTASVENPSSCNGTQGTEDLQSAKPLPQRIFSMTQFITLGGRGG